MFRRAAVCSNTFGACPVCRAHPTVPIVLTTDRGKRHSATSRFLPKYPVNSVLQLLNFTFFHSFYWDAVALICLAAKSPPFVVHETMLSAIVANDGKDRGFATLGIWIEIIHKKYPGYGCPVFTFYLYALAIICPVRPRLIPFFPVHTFPICVGVRVLGLARHFVPIRRAVQPPPIAVPWGVRRRPSRTATRGP